jgi:hypothetical protein
MNYVHLTSLSSLLLSLLLGTGPAQGQQLLDTRSYAPGTYSVELLNDGGRIATERLVLKP